MYLYGRFLGGCVSVEEKEKDFILADVNER